MKRALLGAGPALTLLLAACGGAPQAPVVGVSTGGAAPAVEAPRGAGIAAVTTPDLELRDARGAVVRGAVVPVDGVAEGLAWPALRTAMKRAPGDSSPLTIAIARDVPMRTVMRAVWTLRDADVRVQTPDATGATRVLDLRPKKPAPDAGCHLAVFLTPAGDLRIASPGGARAIPGPDAAGTLARALAAEVPRCPIRYVAFGADSADAPWGSVFDVAAAVDRDKSAGDARYVLGEPVHLTAAAR